jgi:hypothetical protein
VNGLIFYFMQMALTLVKFAEASDAGWQSCFDHMVLHI